MKRLILAGAALVLASGAAYAAPLTGSHASLRADVVARTDCKETKQTIEMDIFHCTKDDSNWYITKAGASAHPAVIRVGVGDKNEDSGVFGSAVPFAQLHDKVIFMDRLSRAAAPAP